MSRSDHYRRKKVDGAVVRVAKVGHATRADAVAHAERLATSGSWPAPRGYNVYVCRTCRLWHAGRAGTHLRTRRSEIDKARLRLYWALWRYANGRPVKKSAEDRAQRIRTAVKG